MMWTPPVGSGIASFKKHIFGVGWRLQKKENKACETTPGASVVGLEFIGGVPPLER